MALQELSPKIQATCQTHFSKRHTSLEHHGNLLLLLLLHHSRANYCWSKKLSWSIQHLHHSRPRKVHIHIQRAQETVIWGTKIILLGINMGTKECSMIGSYQPTWNIEELNILQHPVNVAHTLHKHSRA